jgi:hypothetical protein
MYYSRSSPALWSGCARSASTSPGRARRRPAVRGHSPHRGPASGAMSPQTPESVVRILALEQFLEPAVALGRHLPPSARSAGPPSGRGCRDSRREGQRDPGMGRLFSGSPATAVLPLNCDGCLNRAVRSRRPPRPSSETEGVTLTAGESPEAFQEGGPGWAVDGPLFGFPDGSAMRVRVTRGTVSALPSRTGVPRCPGSPVQLRRCPATVKPAARAAGRARSSGPWPRTSLGRRIVRAATATPARAVRRLSSSVDRRMLCPHRFLGVAARAGRRCPSSSLSVSRSARAGAARPLVTTSLPRAGPTPRSPSRSSPGR